MLAGDSFMMIKAPINPGTEEDRLALHVVIGVVVLEVGVHAGRRQHHQQTHEQAGSQSRRAPGDSWSAAGRAQLRAKLRPSAEVRTLACSRPHLEGVSVATRTTPSVRRSGLPHRIDGSDPGRPLRRLPRGRRSHGTCPCWHSPAPAAPRHRTRASDAAACTACAMALVSVDSIRITGTWGACRVSASATISRSTPSSTAPRSCPAVGLDQLVEAGALGLAAGEPDDALVERLQCRRRRHAGWWPWSRRSSERLRARAIVSILCAPTRTWRKPIADRDGRDPERSGQGGGGQRVGHVVRGRRGDVGDLGQLEGRVPALLDEGTVDQQVIDDTEHRQVRECPG